jgi:hypothetical protein
MTTGRLDSQRALPETQHEDPPRAPWPTPVRAPDIPDAAPGPWPTTPNPAPGPHPAVGARGPLVAVCTLCGGAGASTLTYLLAHSTAVEADDHSLPVLALDAGGTTAGLSLYCRAASARSLAELAEDIRTGRRASTQMFTTTAGGVRLIATAPRLQPDVEPAVLSRILNDAREAHRMTVVDCGTLALPAQRVVLELATHVVWMLPATDHGLQRARLSPRCEMPPDALEVLVARNDPSAKRAPVRALAALAEERRATLVLMPHIQDIGRRSPEHALEVCGVTLQALATKLRQ